MSDGALILRERVGDFVVIRLRLLPESYRYPEPTDIATIGIPTEPTDIATIGIPTEPTDIGTPFSLMAEAC